MPMIGGAGPASQRESYMHLPSPTVEKGCAPLPAGQQGRPETESLAREVYELLLDPSIHCRAQSAPSYDLLCPKTCAMFCAMFFKVAAKKAVVDLRYAVGVCRHIYLPLLRRTVGKSDFVSSLRRVSFCGFS